jgi:hypothetical protein
MTEIITENIHHPLIAAVRLAETACLTALDDDERKAAERALMDAGVALDAAIKKLYDGKGQGRLWDFSCWLDAHRDDLDCDDYPEREARYRCMIKLYEALYAADVDARAMLKAMAMREQGFQAVAERPAEQGALL